MKLRAYRVLRFAVDAMMAPLGYHGSISARDDRVQAVMDAMAQIDEIEDRPCTCGPDDNRPVPCPQKYALSECRAAAEADRAARTGNEREQFEAWWHSRGYGLDATPEEETMAWLTWQAARAALLAHLKGE